MVVGTCSRNTGGQYAKRRSEDRIYRVGRVALTKEKLNRGVDNDLE